MKISIKYYLNKRLKPKETKKGLTYPVYISVSYQRKNHKIKSEIIDFDLLENDFLTNKEILKIIEYERELIRFIVLETENPAHLNLGKRLSKLVNTTVSERFLMQLDKKPINSQIINFISLKTELSKDIFQYYARVDLFSNSQWQELINKNIFDIETKTKILFYVLLVEFEDKYYPVPFDKKQSPLNNFLNIYEWKYKAKQKFIIYANQRNILNTTNINEILKVFDNQLIEWLLFDMFE